MADHKPEVDAATGVADTGHEWDGIRELNNPLPRWWLWTFYATIAWAVVYWVLYPAWPLIWGHTEGVTKWSARTEVVERLDDLKAQRGVLGEQLAKANINEVAGTQDLFNFARAQGKAAFDTNCAQCHGTGASGSSGYPNLNDDDWLWGGSLDQIEFTLRHGVRADDAKTRNNIMPAFGRDGILKRPDVLAVVDYVRSQSGLKAPEGADIAHGEQVFKAQCVSCHGADASGNKELGAPNLRDAIWLYGSDRDTVIASVWNGRGGVMPNWGTRLDDQTIKGLALYVHSLGGGE